MEWISPSGVTLSWETGFHGGCPALVIAGPTSIFVHVILVSERNYIFQGIMAATGSKNEGVAGDTAFQETLEQLNGRVLEFHTALSIVKAKLHHTRPRTGNINDAINLGILLSFLPSCLRLTTLSLALLCHPCLSSCSAGPGPHASRPSYLRQVQVQRFSACCYSTRHSILCLLGSPN